MGKHNNVDKEVKAFDESILVDMNKETNKQTKNTQKWSNDDEIKVKTFDDNKFVV